MENVATKYPDCQENSSDNLFETTDQLMPNDEEFFDMLEQQLRHIARITIITTFNDEFERFIRTAPYQLSADRTNSGNGFQYRSFETRFGVIKDIRISRSRKRRFITKLFHRWNRRETRLLEPLLICLSMASAPER
ncbi:MAG: transposase [candidate division KSB1 bacterium]|nr:transposase [candidate division KSB1 bacterium]